MVIYIRIIKFLKSEINPNYKLNLSIMKKSFLIFLLIVSVMSSCKKEQLVKEIPEIEGSWKWHSTVWGFGVYNEEQCDMECTIIIEEGNRMTVKNGDDFVIKQEKFKVKESDNASMSEYIIELPKKAREKVVESFEPYVVIVDGYIICDEIEETGEVELVINEIPEKGYEDCYDCQRGSAFIKE